jgi:serine/threonine-protein kinase
VDSEPVSDQLIGEVIASRYRIEARIGDGAMGAVYRALHVKVGRPFAVKVLRPSLTGDETLRRRFLREAELAGALHHPAIVGMVDIGETSTGLCYLVMEYVAGDTLYDLIVRAAPLPAPRVIAIVRQLCDGLAHAHEHGLIHRDLKPENVVVERDQRGGDHIKIIDFGISILRDEAISTSPDRLTTAGLVLGTPHYMAPEQALAEPIDHRVDLFALGVMCFEMLTGRAPFDGDGVEVAHANVSVETPAMRDRAPNRAVDPLLEAFTRRLMTKSRDGRPASAAAARVLLDLIDRDRVAAAKLLDVELRNVSRPVAVLAQLSSPMPLPGPTLQSSPAPLSDSVPLPLSGPMPVSGPVPLSTPTALSGPMPLSGPLPLPVHASSPADLRPGTGRSELRMSVTPRRAPIRSAAFVLLAGIAAVMVLVALIASLRTGASDAQLPPRIAARGAPAAAPSPSARAQAVLTAADRGAIATVVPPTAGDTTSGGAAAGGPVIGVVPPSVARSDRALTALRAPRPPERRPGASPRASGASAVAADPIETASGTPAPTSRLPTAPPQASPLPSPQPTSPQPTLPPTAHPPPRANPAPSTARSAAAMDATSIAELYSVVGQELRALEQRKGPAAAADLWPSYLRIRINEALADPAQRETTGDALQRLHAQIGRRADVHCDTTLGAAGTPH